MTLVRFHFVAPDGQPIANGKIEVRLTEAGFRNVPSGIVIPRVLTTETDEDGRAELELLPLPDQSYQVRAFDNLSNRRAQYTFSVPETDVEFVRLQDLVMVPPPSAKPYDEALVAAIQETMFEVQGFAAQAESARDVTNQYYSEVLSAAQQAANDANTVESSIEQAQEQAEGMMEIRMATEAAREEASLSASLASSAKQEAVHAAQDALAVYGTSQAVSDALAQVNADRIAAELAASDSAAARDSASGHRLNAQNARSAAEAAATQTAQDRTAVASDRTAVAGMRDDVTAARIATLQARNTTVARADEVAVQHTVVVAKASQVDAQHAAVQAWMPQVQADKSAVAASALQVRNDRDTVLTKAVQVRDDRIAVADMRQRVGFETNAVELNRTHLDQVAAAVDGDALAVAYDRSVVEGLASNVVQDRAVVEASLQEAEGILGNYQTIDTAVQATMANVLVSSAIQSQTRLDNQEAVELAATYAAVVSTMEASVRIMYQEMMAV